MRRLLLLLLVPVFLFPRAFLGRGVVGADDHLTVHHAFQEEPGGRVRHPQLSDPALQFAALRRRTVAALRAGRAPLWNPDIYAGAPLLADAQSAPASPVTLARLVLPEDAAQDAGVAWVLAWTALGAALLARALGGAPLVAGAAAATGPFVHVWLLHPHSATFAWLPWLLLAVERRSPWAAVALAGMIAGGHPPTAALGLGIALAWWALRSRAPATLLHLGIGALLAAPLWLPFAALASRSETLAERGGLRLLPVQLADLAWPGILGHPAAETWRGPGSWADGQLHPGLAAFALALVAAPRARGLLLAWAACLALAVAGLPGPLPAARLGGMGALFAALAAARAGPARRHELLAAALVLATGAWARRLDQGVLPPEAHDPPPAAWTARLRAEVGDGRVLGLGWALQPNTGALAGLRDLRGYDLPLSRDTHRLMAALEPRPRGPWFPVERLPSLHLLRFADVRAVLAAEPRAALDACCTRVDLGRAPLLAWRVDGAWRAWVAPAAERVDDPAAGLRAIAAADRRARPPVSGPLPPELDRPPPPGAVPTPVEVVEETPERLRVRVGGRAGVLVVADAWAPGWTAAADGRPVEVRRAGGAFRAVVLRAPAREVVLRYRPRAWTAGCALGAAGALGLLGLALTGRRRAGMVWPWPG